MRHKILFFAFLFFIFLTIYSSTIPFFWDGTFFSAIACKFYDGTYTIFNYPPIPDNNTTFPLFSMYLFFAWKIFGKTLLVSHLTLLPFLLGICYEFYQLSKRFLQERFVLFAMLLLILEPTFITQSLLMSSDIILLYLFLMLLNRLLKEQYTTYTFVIPLLAMYSVRGIFLAFSLAMIQFILLFPQHKYKSFFTVLKNNFLSLIFAGGFIFYKYHTAESFASSSTNRHEQAVSLSMMFRQFLFIGWKLMDFGRIILWLFFIIGSFFIYRKTNSSDLKTLVIIIFIPVIITAAFMIPFSNPIGHRYFMFSYLLLMIATCYLLQQINNNKIIYSLLIALGAAMISGNFWLYPERYGNGWDSSLKVVPYFQLKENMDNYIQQNNIDVNEVGTQFPLIADKCFSHLSDTSYHYKNVWSGPIDDYHYFLQSNVINTDIPAQIEEVKKSWTLLKEFRSGEVYLRLYENKLIPATLQ